MIYLGQIIAASPRRAGPNDDITLRLPQGGPVTFQRVDNVFLGPPPGTTPPGTTGVTYYRCTFRVLDLFTMEATLPDVSQTDPSKPRPGWYVLVVTGGIARAETDTIEVLLQSQGVSGAAVIPVPASVGPLGPGAGLLHAGYPIPSPSPVTRPTLGHLVAPVPPVIITPPPAPSAAPSTTPPSSGGPTASSGGSGSTSGGPPVSPAPTPTAPAPVPAPAPVGGSGEFKVKWLTIHARAEVATNTGRTPPPGSPILSEFVYVVEATLVDDADQPRAGVAVGIDLSPTPAGTRPGTIEILTTKESDAHERFDPSTRMVRTGADGRVFVRVRVDSYRSATSRNEPFRVCLISGTESDILGAPPAQFDAPLPHVFAPDFPKADQAPVEEWPAPRRSPNLLESRVSLDSDTDVSFSKLVLVIAASLADQIVAGDPSIPMDVATAAAAGGFLGVGRGSWTAIRGEAEDLKALIWDFPTAVASWLRDGDNAASVFKVGAAYQVAGQSGVRMLYRFDPDTAAAMDRWAKQLWDQAKLVEQVVQHIRDNPEIIVKELIREVCGEPKDIEDALIAFEIQLRDVAKATLIVSYMGGSLVGYISATVCVALLQTWLSAGVGALLAWLSKVSKLAAAGLNLLRGIGKVMSELTAAMKTAARSAVLNAIFTRGGRKTADQARQHAGRALAVAGNAMGHADIMSQQDLARRLNELTLDGDGEAFLRFCARLSDEEFAQAWQGQEVSDKLVLGVNRALPGADGVQQKAHALEWAMKLAGPDPHAPDGPRLVPDPTELEEYMVGLRRLACGC